MERPTIDDCASLGTPALIERYARGVERIDRRVLQLNDAQSDTFFRPEAGVGRWSCRVLLGHVADAEIVYTHRMRRTAAEERPVLAAWDENAFIDAGLYGEGGAGPGLPVAGSIALVHTVRLWTTDWLRMLDERALDRRALHPERGEETVRRMLALAAWHLEHHAWFLSRKVERLLGAP